MKETEVKVLPEPVAICTSERGRSAASDFSRLPMAVNWAGQSPSRVQRRHAAQAAAVTVRRPDHARIGHFARLVGRVLRTATGNIQPLGQCFGAMKGKYRTGTGIGIEPAGKKCLNAGGLIAKSERTEPGGKRPRQPLSVAVGLNLDSGESHTGLLGFDHPGGFTVNIQQIVSETEAALQRKFANRNATTGMQVDAVSCPAPASRLRPACGQSLCVLPVPV